MSKNFIKAIPMIEVNANTFTGNYIALGDPLPVACAILRIVNDTDQDVVISFDGATAHDYIPHGDTLQLSLQANSAPHNKVALIAKGTIVYACAGPGAGLLCVAGYYNLPN